MTQDTTVEVWQEYDCPHCGIDFDLHEGEIVCAGQSFYCSGCAGNHVAGVDGPDSTYVRLSGAELQILGLPADEAQRAAWLRGEI